MFKALAECKFNISCIEEEWRPVIYRNIKIGMYEVSNLGRIRNSQTKHIMSLCPSEKGYMMVTVRCDDGKTKTMKFHRIVATMFVPGYSEINCEVNHIDGDKSNNRAENLEWVSHTYNIHHAYDHNLIPKIFGERHGNHSLKDSEITEICKSLVKHNGDCRKAYDEISKQGIMCKLQHVQRIKYKITGRHISDVYFEDDQFKKQYKVQRLSKLTQSY